MHDVDFDLTVDDISKIEGTAALDIKVRNGNVEECKFIISEFKRFYTQAIIGKPVSAVPQLVARICGTCSNAHLLCNLKALEQALNIQVSPQTQLLRELLNYGLIIRDHGLHLYVFVLPDLFNKSSILDFDENNQEQHRLLDDCFSIKAAGNNLSIAAAGRSVHAPFATIGGFTKIPSSDDLKKITVQLQDVRPKVIYLIEIFKNCQFQLNQELEFVGLTDNKYSFLNGEIFTSEGIKIVQNDFGKYLEKTVIPYSQASGYKFNGKIHMVGALARINLNQQSLHANTKHDAEPALRSFPSKNIFHNNLAQAIEILHAIDSAIDLINQYQAIQEAPVKYESKQSLGVGIIEAPRGTLYHKMEISNDGKITNGQIVVPTGQNQIGIERSILNYVQNNISQPKDVLQKEIEKIIRAYDPCMSCASHFLKIKWK